MVTLLAQMRDWGKTIFVVTHQAALLEGAATGLSGWKPGRSRIAAGNCSRWRRNEQTSDVPSG